MKKVKAHKICVVGAGHVGLVAAACFAKLGHTVTCVDSDKKRIEGLKKGKTPFYEPELDALVRGNLRRKRLTFTYNLSLAVRKSEVFFIAVGTPPQEDGSADLTAVENVAQVIARNLNGYKLVVGKSTVPVQTGQKIKQTILRYRKNHTEFDVASNPEFLREGKAVHDFFYPDRIVIGVESRKAETRLRQIYAALKAPVVVTDVNTAELIKHASNSFLATKISFINAVSRICDLVGADVEKIAQAMGLDKRIGKDFLNAGIGYGGFCLDRREKLIVRDSAGSVRLMPIEELFSEYKQNKKYNALSFDVENKRIVYKKLAFISSRKYRSKMITFTTAMNRKVTVTADHPMLIWDEKTSTCKTLCADEVTTGDYFMLFTSMPSAKDSIIIDLFDYLKETDEISHIKVRPVKNVFSNLPSAAFALLKEENNYSSCKVHDFKRKNYLLFDDYLTLERHGLLTGYSRDDMLLFTTKGTPTYIKGRFQVDRKFLSLLGFYISEGHITTELSERGQRDRIVFTFNEKEKEFIEATCDALDSLGIRCVSRHIPLDKSFRITVSSRILSYLLKKVLACGVNSYDAAIPSFLFNSSREDKLEFMRSMHCGDGSVYFPTYTPSVTYEFGTVSRPLRDSFAVLLHSVGVVPSLKQFRSAKATVDAYAIRISGYDQIRQLPMFKGKDYQDRIDSRLKSYHRHMRPTGYRKIHDDFCIVKVRKKDEYYTDELVYSAEVDDTNTFITAEGIIVHNCFPKDLEAFIYISKKLGYDFNLLKEVKEVNESQKSYFVEKLKEFIWVLKDKKIAVLGLSFKPDTDDMRFAPSIDIVSALLDEGAHLFVYDPQAMGEAKRIFCAESLGQKARRIHYCKDVYSALRGCDCACFLTEWKELASVDFKKLKKIMRLPFIADGRNMFEGSALAALGFTYIGIGR